MSQENVEVVRRLYGLWPDRVSTAQEVLDPDVVIDIAATVLTPAIYHGVDGFLRFVERIGEMWEELQVEPEELSMRVTMWSRSFGCRGCGAAAP